MREITTNRKLLILGPLATALLLVPACGSDGFDLQGHMTLIQTDSSAGGLGGGEPRGGSLSCFGLGGYSDIAEGTAITVYDAAGQVIATGKLGPGSAVIDPVEGGFDKCRFGFAVAEVPANEDFYQIEVSHRGKVTFDAEEARAGTVALTLGA